MKAQILVACAAAALALAGCNKNNSNNAGSAPGATENVTITQASPPHGGT